MCTREYSIACAQNYHKRIVNKYKKDLRSLVCKTLFAKPKIGGKYEMIFPPNKFYFSIHEYWMFYTNHRYKVRCLRIQIGKVVKIKIKIKYFQLAAA